MKSDLIVNPFNVSEYICTSLRAGLILLVMYPFVFQGAEKALHHSIIITSAFVAHADLNMVGCQDISSCGHFAVLPAPWQAIWRINRAIRFLLQVNPCFLNWAYTRGLPYVLRLSLWILRICSISAWFCCSRWFGLRFFHAWKVA
jgi:hypothetical protein